ncbi:hypothetical protein CHS0354_021740 [Potamilus streckersoni]|uniref:Uncharacterized protein n=1 Tax=Potamilus streckersoni TaxID=2493646 RepID=A0AAE0TKS7_9BIVA|nr:hypothetical protein CHS0354_021740 [Potamilus streckersoni]
MTDSNETTPCTVMRDISSIQPAARSFLIPVCAVLFLVNKHNAKVTEDAAQLQTRTPFMGAFPSSLETNGSQPTNNAKLVP